jgi:hypothetical protein
MSYGSNAPTWGHLVSSVSSLVHSTVQAIPELGLFSPGFPPHPARACACAGAFVFAYLVLTFSCLHTNHNVLYILCITREKSVKISLADMI